MSQTNDTPTDDDDNPAMDALKAALVQAHADGDQAAIEQLTKLANDPIALADALGWSLAHAPDSRLPDDEADDKTDNTNPGD